MKSNLRAFGQLSCFHHCRWFSSKWGCIFLVWEKCWCPCPLWSILPQEWFSLAEEIVRNLPKSEHVRYQLIRHCGDVIKNSSPMHRIAGFGGSNAPPVHQIVGIGGSGGIIDKIWCPRGLWEYYRLHLFTWCNQVSPFIWCCRIFLLFCNNRSCQPVTMALATVA